MRLQRYQFADLLVKPRLLRGVFQQALEVLHGFSIDWIVAQQEEKTAQFESQLVAYFAATLQWQKKEAFPKVQSQEYCNSSTVSVRASAAVAVGGTRHVYEQKVALVQGSIALLQFAKMVDLESLPNGAHSDQSRDEVKDGSGWESSMLDSKDGVAYYKPIDTDAAAKDDKATTSILLLLVVQSKWGTYQGRLPDDAANVHGDDHQVLEHGVQTYHEHIPKIDDGKQGTSCPVAGKNSQIAEHTSACSVDEKIDGVKQVPSVHYKVTLNYDSQDVPQTSIGEPQNLAGGHDGHVLGHVNIPLSDALNSCKTVLGSDKMIPLPIPKVWDCTFSSVKAKAQHPNGQAMTAKDGNIRKTSDTSVKKMGENAEQTARLIQMKIEMYGGDHSDCCYCFPWISPSYES